MLNSTWKMTLLGALAALAVAAPASASPTVTISPTSDAATWTSAPGNGANVSYFADLGAGPSQLRGSCGSDPQNNCDLTLVHITDAPLSGGSVKFRIDGFQPVSDFDLRVYGSDASGAEYEDLSDPQGDVAAGSPLGSNDPRHTSVGDFETTEIPLGGYVDDEGEAWFLVKVPYFLVANDSYTGHATLLP